MRQRHRNTDDEIRSLRRLYDQAPDEDLLAKLVAAMLRAGDHRGLVSLGPAAIPVLRELDGGTRSLARRVRVDIVRLELSILTSSVDGSRRLATFTASPLRDDGDDDGIPISLWMTDGVFDHQDSDSHHQGRPLSRFEIVSASPASGGFGKRIPLADVVHVGDAARDAYTRSAGGWRVAQLGFDGDPIGGENGQWIEAFLFGDKRNGAHTWNGWARPFMTLDQVRAFIAIWNQSNEEGGSLTFELREDPDGFVVVHRDDNAGDDAEPIVIQPEWVEGPNSPGEGVYDMGFGLVWLERDED